MAVRQVIHTPQTLVPGLVGWRSSGPASALWRPDSP
jgi:hypothetical protein